MNSPMQVLQHVGALLKDAHGHIAAKQWDTARTAIEAALKLDENNASAYEAMAELSEAQGDAGKCAQWRDKSQLARKQAWQRQVEAEARGHHDLLGETSRHEIP